MDIITSLEFAAICHDENTHTIKFGKVDQPKVFEKDGNIIIKLFYPKKSKLSSDRIRPRALRFYRNVKKLHVHGYSVPIVEKVKFCPDLKMYMLYYPKILGNNVRVLARSGHLDVIRHVALLLADLHVKGIFYRSIHLENLLYQPDGKLALLDVTDVKFKSRALSVYYRYRNLKHLLHEPHDKSLWKAFGIENFMNEYFKHAGLSNNAEKILRYLIKRITTSPTQPQTSFAVPD